MSRASPMTAVSLILIDGDPTQDISAVRNVALVLQGGDEARLAADEAQKAAPVDQGEPIMSRGGSGLHLRAGCTAI